MDSFKLVRPSSVRLAIGGRGGRGISSRLALHDWLLHVRTFRRAMVSRYIAPLTEETAKALFIVVLSLPDASDSRWTRPCRDSPSAPASRWSRTSTYLRSMPAAPPAFWIVRGLGTAVLHGTTTVIFAMMSKTLADRRLIGRCALAFVPGLGRGRGDSLGVQSPPAAAACADLAVAVGAAAAGRCRVPAQRARDTRVGRRRLDLDIELLDLVGVGAFRVDAVRAVPAGAAARIPGPVVADMFCLLRLELELSVQAKAMLLAREAGLEVPADDDLEAILAERRLPASINRQGGTAGLEAAGDHEPREISGTGTCCSRAARGRVRAD